MPKRLSRKLAGCFAIELLFAAGLAAADSDYQAGTAATGKVKALALEDRRGTRAVFASAEFGVTQAVADFIAAQVVRRTMWIAPACCCTRRGKAIPHPTML